MIQDKRPITGNPWQPFGLRGDPFFQEELGAGSGSNRPAKVLFVGRENELRRCGGRIGGAGQSRTIIQGEAGVGKTSFVNYLKGQLAGGGDYAVHEQPIRITSRTTPESFLADVLRVLVRVNNEGDGPRDEFWKRVAQLVEAQTSTSGGISIAGFGAQIDKEHRPATISEESLVDAVGDALARIRDDFDRQVVLHVNNLENLALEETDRARFLVQNVRDVFLRDGGHWLFVGSEDIDSTIFRRSDQVGGAFPTPITLEPLSRDDLEELLRRRYDHLHDSKNRLVYPVEPATASELYELYRGDLRNFLRLLGDAAEMVLGIEAVAPMTKSQILQAAGREYRARILERVNDQDFAHLVDAEAEADGDPFRVTDVADWVDLHQSSASRLMQRLQNQGLIEKVSRKGRSVYYRPTGTASVALAVE